MQCILVFFIAIKDFQQKLLREWHAPTRYFYLLGPIEYGYVSFSIFCGPKIIYLVIGPIIPERKSLGSSFLYSGHEISIFFRALFPQLQVQGEKMGILDLIKKFEDKKDKGDAPADSKLKKPS